MPKPILKKKWPKNKNVKIKRPKKEARVAAKENNIGNNSAVANSISQLSREEKNTMKVCPLYGTRMKLNDNYRANASDFRQCDEYPFAKQLSYRRYCPVCTRKLEQEEKRFEKEEKRNANQATFSRCEVYNKPLFINGDHSSLNYEKDPDPECPHAKQYLFKEYCKTCTKVYKAKYGKKEEQ